jgi:CBS domain-containing protein
MMLQCKIIERQTRRTIMERTIRDIIKNQQPITAPAAMSVRQAASVMKQRRIGAMMVVEAGVLVGIFTERDALNGVVAEGRDTQTTTLAEVMTHNPQTVSPDATFNAALELMHEGRFRHVPVVDNGVPVGMISVRDAMGSELESFVYEILRQEQVSQVLA